MTVLKRTNYKTEMPLTCEPYLAEDGPLPRMLGAVPVIAWSYTNLVFSLL